VYTNAHGGGGCSAGAGGSSGGMLLMIGAALLGRRRRRRLVLAAALVGGTASADTRDLDLAIFHPTPSTTGSDFQLQSASVGARGDLMLHAKGRLVTSGRLAVALAGSLELPTATAGQFAGVASPQGRVLGLLSFALDPRVALHVNAGGVFRPKAEFQNVAQ